MLRTLAVALFAFLAASCGDNTTEASGKPRVVVIPKGVTHTFWQAVREGAEKGGEMHGCDVVFKGPLDEGARAEQIKLVQQFVGEGVAGIALAPLDHTALAPAVKRAKASGIPVVIFDSALDGTAGKDFDSFVATDNEQAGALAGEHLAKLVGDEGKVVMMRYLAGSASTEKREKGFLRAMKDKGIEVLVDNRFAGPTIGEAKTTALNMADALREANGVFCSNESATVGMLLALDSLKLTGQLKFVGFDSSDPLRKALGEGKLDALVVQDPRRMGQLSVEHLKKLIDGETVDTVVDTGAVLATKANMEHENIAPLLK